MDFRTELVLETCDVAGRIGSRSREALKQQPPQSRRLCCGSLFCVAGRAYCSWTCKVSPAAMAEHHALIFGTEKDKVNCPFYYKIGACRHGDRCARTHNKPLFSQTLLLANLYVSPDQIVERAAALRMPSPDIPAEERESHFDDFYEDVYNEMSRFGRVEAMVVCENRSDHLAGNTYVKFTDEDSARAALAAMQGRWYAGRPVLAEYSPVTDLSDGKCRKFEEETCERGDFCHFMHARRLPDDLYRRLYGKRPRSSDWKAEEGDTGYEESNHGHGVESRQDPDLPNGRNSVQTHEQELSDRRGRDREPSGDMDYTNSSGDRARSRERELDRDKDFPSRDHDDRRDRERERRSGDFRDRDRERDRSRDRDRELDRGRDRDRVGEWDRSNYSDRSSRDYRGHGDRGRQDTFRRSSSFGRREDPWRDHDREVYRDRGRERERERERERDRARSGESYRVSR